MAFETLAEIDAESTSRLKLKANESGIWTATQRTNIYNIAQREICKLTDCLKATYTYTSTASTFEYAFTLFSAAANIRKIDSEEGILFNDGTSTLRIPYKSIYWLDEYSTGWRDSTTDQTPSYYYIRQNKYLGFDTPTTAGKVITLNAIIKPTAVSSPTDKFFNGEAYLTEEFSEAIIEFFLWRAYRQWGIAYAPLMSDAQNNFFNYIKEFKWDLRRVPDERNGITPYMYRRRFQR